MARIVSIKTDEKEAVHMVHTGCTQVLRRLITKIVMLVRNNEFDSPTEEPLLNFQNETHLSGAK